MKITLKLVRDSNNSHPTDEIEFTCNDIEIEMKIGNRRIALDKSEFIKMLHMME